MKNTTTQDYITVTHNLFVSDNNIYQVILNYYVDGKRQQKWKSTKIKAIPGNKKLAKQKATEIAREFEEELNSNLEQEVTTPDIETTDILYGDYLIDWLENIKSSIELTTYASYKNKVETIAKYFNELEIKLVDLRRSDIKKFYKHLSKTKQIKNKTIKRYHANIHKSLVDAIELELINNNPADNINLDKSEQFIASHYNQQELEQLFEVSRGNAIELHILLASYYGLRREEVCGLKWSAIDFFNHTITISHVATHANVDGKYLTITKDRTKNNSSYRTLPLIPNIENILIEKKKEQEEHEKYFGNAYKNTDGYILVNEEGKLIRPDYVTNAFRKLLINHKLKRIRFHDLRHSCASLLLKNGIHMKEIQAWLGHSNFNTTATLYAHLESDTKQNSANVITNVFASQSA